MSTTRTWLYALLSLVALAAAITSFEALRGLALLCGFTVWTAPLLPAVVDAGAAAGTLAWLTGDGRDRRFGRALALALLGLSVCGNAVGHALTAYAAQPHWGLVVVVSGVAPAVLGAVVHLAVVASQTVSAGAELAVEPLDDPARDVGMVDEHGLSRLWADAPLVDPPAGDPVGEDRAAELIGQGAGRRRLSRELGITEHAARELLSASRNGVAR